MTKKITLQQYHLEVFDKNLETKESLYSKTKISGFCKLEIPSCGVIPGSTHQL